MPPIVLFEDSRFIDLLPLLYWRTVFELRCGRRTLAERVAARLGRPIDGLWVRDWMSSVAAGRFAIPVNEPVQPDTVLLNGRWLPAADLDFRRGPFVGTVRGRIAYVVCDEKLAARLRPGHLLDDEASAELADSVEHDEIDADLVAFPWDLVTRNAEVLARDWSDNDRGIAGTVGPAATLVKPESIHVGAGARIDAGAVLDASAGPIYVADEARVMPQSVILGPASIGHRSVVNPHAYIHGGTSIGPVCKIGGEIDACVITGYSNKQHDGFLGHAVVGSWVNLGAGTTNSDLKNTYGPVRVMLGDREVDTGLTFFGSIIADHVKTGIQQTLPTGCVIGFGSMVACGGMVPRFVPSMTWLTDKGTIPADPARQLETARRMMQRRSLSVSPAEEVLFAEAVRRARLYESGAGTGE